MRNLRLRRLKSDYEAVRRLVRLHPRVDIEGTSGNPPDRYIFALQVCSLRERGTDIVAQTAHRLEVELPLGYPRDAPICRMLTSVFHPNIAPHAVCIGDHWSASESLDLMIQRVGEMLAYQSYSIKSPLNGRAAQWVDEHPGEVPTDPREFFVDLAVASPVEDTASFRCANCSATDVALASCRQGHMVCGDCRLECTSCQRILCLVCGDLACPEHGAALGRTIL